jgi:hypothetical protein
MPEIEYRRKRPLVIEMLLWDGTNFEQVAAFTSGSHLVDLVRHGGGQIDVWNDQEDAWFAVPPGHYVVKSTLGEFYPRSPEAREATTEPGTGPGTGPIAVPEGGGIALRPAFSSTVVVAVSGAIDCESRANTEAAFAADGLRVVFVENAAAIAEFPAAERERHVREMADVTGAVTAGHFKSAIETVARQATFPGLDAVEASARNAEREQLRGEFGELEALLQIARQQESLCKERLGAVRELAARLDEEGGKLKRNAGIGSDALASLAYREGVTLERCAERVRKAASGS